MAAGSNDKRSSGRGLSRPAIHTGLFPWGRALCRCGMTCVWRHGRGRSIPACVWRGIAGGQAVEARPFFRVCPFPAMRGMRGRACRSGRGKGRGETAALFPLLSGLEREKRRRGGQSLTIRPDLSGSGDGSRGCRGAEQGRHRPHTGTGRPRLHAGRVAGAHTGRRRGCGQGTQGGEVPHVLLTPSVPWPCHGLASPAHLGYRFRKGPRLL